MCHCTSNPHGVTGIKLHYIRLLAGLELVLSSTAPANNPTEHWAHIQHYTDFLHPIFWASDGLLIHSFLLISLFSFFPYVPFPHLSLTFFLGNWCILLSSFWDQAERQAERARLSKSLVVLKECIILLMFCHCCCTHSRGRQCRTGSVITSIL